MTVSDLMDRIKVEQDRLTAEISAGMPVQEAQGAMKVYQLTRGGQDGLFSCLVTAGSEDEALGIAKENHFSFTQGLAGNSIKEIDTSRKSFNLLIEFEDPDYEG